MYALFYIDKYTISSVRHPRIHRANTLCNSILLDIEKVTYCSRDFLAKQNLAIY